MPNYDSLLSEDMAAEHYLSGCELGGTNFYRYRKYDKVVLSKSDDPINLGSLKQHQVSNAQVYIVESNDVFEKIHIGTAKLNRVVIYSGNIILCTPVTEKIEFEKTTMVSRQLILFKCLN